MIKLSRGAWIAVAAAAAIPATVAIAATAERAGWNRMTPETRARLDEGRLAMAKTALKLTPDQEKLWTPLETQVRAFLKDREAKHAEREKMHEEMQKQRADGKRPDMAAHLEKMSQKMSEGADRMKSFSGAFSPFYATLSEEQKDVLRPLAHDFMPGKGRHGGDRWAQGGGWGPEGRGEHHDWGGKRHHGEHGDRGGDRWGDRDGREDGPGAEPGGAPKSDDAKPAEKL